MDGEVGVGRVSFETGVGTVVGVADGDLVRVRGVPYASAGRFEAPVAAKPFDAPFVADRRAPVSPQHRSPLLGAIALDLADDTVQDEHCQRLSITTPADLADDERLPVLVWVHGGSYVTGGGDLSVYDPDQLVREQRVIVVTVTYRLGLLGFLGDGGQAPGNLGLLDLIEALRWVRTNIAAFGGDPHSTTVFGQSAGGDAIVHLMIAEGVRGLFRRAIVQSAPLGIMDGRQAMTRAMLDAVGEFPRDAPVSEVLETQLRTLLAAKGNGLRGRMPYGPQYGMAPLPPEAERGAAWVRAASDIDVLIGHTAQEARLALVGSRLFDRISRHRLSDRILDGAVMDPVTRRMYGHPAARFARRHRTAGGTAVEFVSHWRPHGSRFGAAHVTELPLLLGSRAAWRECDLLGDHPWDDIERRGRAARRAWAEFARTGAITAEAREDLADTMTLSA